MATLSVNTGLVSPGQLIGREAEYQPSLATFADAKGFYFASDIIAQIVRQAVNIFPGVANDNTPLRAVITASGTSFAITVSTT